jgi:hypothetical protein
MTKLTIKQKKESITFTFHSVVTEMTGQILTADGTAKRGGRTHDRQFLLTYQKKLSLLQLIVCHAFGALNYALRHGK